MKARMITVALEFKNDESRDMYNLKQFCSKGVRFVCQ